MTCPNSWFLPPCPEILPIAPEATYRWWEEILGLHIARLRVTRDERRASGLTYSTQWSYVPRR